MYFALPRQALIHLQVLSPYKRNATQYKQFNIALDRKF